MHSYQVPHLGLRLSLPVTPTPPVSPIGCELPQTETRQASAPRLLHKEGRTQARPLGRLVCTIIAWGRELQCDMQPYWEARERKPGALYIKCSDDLKDLI